MRIQKRRLNKLVSNPYYINLRKITSRRGVKESLSLGLSFLLISFLIVFALQPSLTKIVELRKEIASEEKTLKRLKKKTEALNRIESIWARVQDDSRAIEKTIPLGPDYDYFVKEMEWLADKNGVVYVNGSFAESVIKSNLAELYNLKDKLEPVEIGVSLKFEGDYGSLEKLLEDLLSLDRIVDVGSVSLSQSEKKESKGQLVLTINGKIYYLGNKSTIEKILQQKRKRR